MGYVDCRDWPRYNEALVRRGEIFLGLDAMEEWEEELKGMNRGKEGASFDYPDGFIKLLGFVRLLFHLPYRQTEGFMRGLAQHVQGLLTPNYTTINRRLNRLPAELDLEDVEGDEPVTIAVDASGVKVYNGGDWIRRQWKVRKGYLKVHVAVDVKTKQIVAMEVTSEAVGDNRMFKPLVKAAMERRRPLGRVLADGAYDAKENFNLLAECGIAPGIRVRRSSAPRSRGSMPRKLAVLEQLKDPRAWRRRHGYGYRWRAEEAFSRLKRLFGEYVSARRFMNMVKEMLLKASLLNLLTQLTAQGNQ